MKFGVLFFICSVFLMACSKDDLPTIPTVEQPEIASVNYDGRWATGCIDDAFGGGKQSLELSFDKKKLEYVETFYADEFCQDVSAKNEYNGSIRVIRNASDESQVLQFSIPIDANISALRYFNVKKDKNILLISQFHSDDKDSNADLIFQLSLDAK